MSKGTVIIALTKAYIADITSLTKKIIVYIQRCSIITSGNAKIRDGPRVFPTSGYGQMHQN